MVDFRDKSGWIYVAKGKDMGEFRYKIGQTKRDPLIRVKELSITQESMELLMTKFVSDRFKAERKLFSLLSEFMPDSKKELVDVRDFEIIESHFNYVEDLFPVNKDKGIKIVVGDFLKDK